jgi:hypothetical protein
MRRAQQVEVYRSRGHHLTGTAFRRVSWDDPDQLYAMVLCAFGINPRIVAAKTGMTVGQVNWRKKVTGIKTMDYRNMSGRGIAAQVSRGIVGELAGRYTNVVRDRLPETALPTKKETKRNGNGHALTLAHAGRRIRD